MRHLSLTSWSREASEGVMAERGSGGQYWPQQLNRFHPYGRGSGRGRVQLNEGPGRGIRKPPPDPPPLGFLVDRTAAPSCAKEPLESKIPIIHFVTPRGQRLTREFVLFAHHPPNLAVSLVRQAVSRQLAPYGSVDVKCTRSAILIHLTNPPGNPDFDPSSPTCRSLMLGGDAFLAFSAVFHDVKKRLLHTQPVDYKQIEAHMVLATSFQQQLDMIREQVSEEVSFDLLNHRHNRRNTCTTGSPDAGGPGAATRASRLPPESP